jgi:hypothetical protein
MGYRIKLSHKYLSPVLGAMVQRQTQLDQLPCYDYPCRLSHIPRMITSCHNTPNANVLPLLLQLSTPCSMGSVVTRDSKHLAHF